MMQRGPSAKTIRNHLNAISSFCDFLVRRGSLATNPARGLKPPPLQKKIPLYLCDDEYRRTLVAAAREGIFAEVALALNTGMRMGELKRLKWDDVAIADRKLYIRMAKNYKARVIFLNTMAQAVLRYQRRRTGLVDYVFPARQTFRGGWKWKNKARNDSWFVRAIIPL